MGEWVRRWRLIVIVVVTVVLVVAVTGIYRSSEPSYGGRTLSAWLDDAISTGLGAREGNPKWESATNAVYQIGTEAIPSLSRWLVAKDSALRTKVVTWFNKHPSFHIRLRTARDRRLEAYYGFIFLMEKGKPGWPLFVEMTRDADASRRWWGLHCLVKTEANAEVLQPVLSGLAFDRDAGIRDYAAQESSKFDAQIANGEEMKPGRVILTLIMVISMAAILSAILHSSEPRYEGRTLSEWIEAEENIQFESNGDSMDCEMDPKWREATNAVYQIGTNAVPWLVKWGQCEGFAAQGGGHQMG